LIATNPGFPPGFFVGYKYSMTYIFESPDGGDTVYRREFGKPQRELHSISEEKRRWDQQLEEEMLWVKIAQASRTNPALREALDQARIIYELSRDD
jgi:hypothetical protein